MNNLWYIRTVEIKKCELLMPIETWMNLKGVMMTEKKPKIYMLYNYLLLHYRNIILEKQNKTVVAKCLELL